RIEDWLTHLPSDGIRTMCSWERFCTFAREPEKRTVGIDCRLTVAGVAYEVDPEVAGETVIVWWGLFDQELYVEFGEERFGPFLPVGGPIPLHRYRKHRKSRREVRADAVADLAKIINIPRSALSGEDDVVVLGGKAQPLPLSQPFVGPDIFQTFTFTSKLAARQAIADELRLPLAKLNDDDRAFIGNLIDETLSRPIIINAVRER
ncbi:IS481 family transposase, partial [Bacillus anthracis]